MVTPGQMVDVHADYCDYACVSGGAGCVQTVCPELFWSHPQPTNFLKIRTDQPFHPAQGCRHGGMRTEKGSRLRVLDMDIRMTLQKAQFWVSKTDGNPLVLPFWYGGSLT